MLRCAALGLATLIFGIGNASAAVADPRRVLIYGDSNTWGYEAQSDGKPTRRYPPDQRWTGILGKELGPDYVIIEDGLNLRTTDLDGEDWPDSIVRPNAFNGAKHLPVSIAANMPLDLVVIMLGTNDLQARYHRSAREIAKAAVTLARLVRASAGGIGTSYPAPKVLLVSPVQIATVPVKDWNKRYMGGREKSVEFSAAFRSAARETGIPVFDAASAIGGGAHEIDGVHLSNGDHRRMAIAIAPAIREVLARD